MTKAFSLKAPSCSVKNGISNNYKNRNDDCKYNQLVTQEDFDKY
jgi:hypothetical protein